MTPAVTVTVQDAFANNVPGASVTLSNNGVGNITAFLNGPPFAQKLGNFTIGTGPQGSLIGGSINTLVSGSVIQEQKYVVSTHPGPAQPTHGVCRLQFGIGDSFSAQPENQWERERLGEVAEVLCP